MDKVTERIQVLQENNTAQTSFESLLQSKQKKNNEISIATPLSGNIDLKRLASLGFSKIRHILFSSGQITHIDNYPDGITHFTCSDNLLQNVDQLPDTIEVLDVTHNLISSIDLSRMTRLKVLRISHNELDTLEGLPESLEELYCNYNKIQKLQLKNTPNLRVLHCEANHSLQIEHLPDTVVDIKLPETVIMNHYQHNHGNASGKGQIVHKEYDQYVKEYYKIKSKYETELKKIRSNQNKTANKTANKNKPRYPKCIGCGKPVGMIFSRKDEKLTAICGHSQPCDWKIVIHRGFFQDHMTMLYSFIDELESIKQNIIQHKLNTVFEYIAEKDSARLFEKEMKMFQSSSEITQRLLDTFNEKYFSETKSHAIRDKQRSVQEFLLQVKENLDNGDVEQAVRIQYENIAPLMKSIQHDCYEITKIISEKKKQDMIVQVPTNDDPKLTHYLIQEEISMYKIDQNLGEDVFVEHFGTKK